MSTPSLPDELRAALERLFELFSFYVAAPTRRDRNLLHAEILDLFSRLGVVSADPLARRAAEMLQQIQAERPIKLREAILRMMPAISSIESCGASNGRRDRQCFLREQSKS